MHPEFLFFFNQCETDLRAYIGAMVRDPHARDDIFQEVSRTLWQKFDQYDMNQSFGAWARGIATMKLLEARRKNSRFPLLLSQEAMEAVQEVFDEGETVSRDHEVALQLCLESLQPKFRQVLAWRYEGRMKCESIASRLGIKVNALHQMLRRLRVFLEQCVEQRLAKDDFAPSPVSESAESPVTTIL